MVDRKIILDTYKKGPEAVISLFEETFSKLEKGSGAKNEQRLHKTWIPNGISSYTFNPNKCWINIF
ncbi:hypothetical protein ACQKFU_31430 [Bacillus mycoides]|uniref:hypothetical protein n=1 Tax=Bacillus mycoides TaxID=1405 RepID=UPI003CFC91E8